MTIRIRKAKEEDIGKIAEIYDAIHTMEEEGLVTIGWQRDVYPTEKTAAEAVRSGDMFVEEDDGIIVAAARINKEQVYPAYEQVEWIHQCDKDQVMVIHTLVVDPKVSGKAYGKNFVSFYEKYAAEAGCSCLRLDTNERNERARGLYKGLGYVESGIIPCTFNGISSVNLVCLEKKI